MPDTAPTVLDVDPAAIDTALTAYDAISAGLDDLAARLSRRTAPTDAELLRGLETRLRREVAPTLPYALPGYRPGGLSHGDEARAIASAIENLRDEVDGAVLYGYSAPGQTITGITGITREITRACGLLRDLRASWELQACTCVEYCREDPATACSLHGQPHTHPDDGSGVMGPCPVHPDRPGDR